jgi:carbon monoxide dehydrogenase subunit G
MKLEHSFQVKAPLERVWEALVDVERVAPCLPGAEISEVGEDGTYRGSFTVKLGPTTAAYRGELAMEEVDAEAHRSVMRASGSDKRGQGSAKATIVSNLRQQGDVTAVDVETDFTITGRLARFGRGGMIQDVSNRLLRDFSDCLQQTIESAEPRDAEAAPSSGPGAEAATAGPASDAGTAGPGVAGPAGPASAGPAGLASAGPAGADPPVASSRSSRPASPADRSPASPPAAKPVSGFSLLFRALLDRLRRAFGRR